MCAIRSARHAALLPNLTALRELAMRVAADRVDAEMVT
jgi:K+-sensing histidine kinase KdpD